jgi:predicted DNA-binding transcriptional regulator AlpA
MYEQRNFYRPEHLGRRWGVSGSSIRRWAAAGALPAPTRLSARVFGWTDIQVAEMEQAGKKPAGKPADRKGGAK